MKKQTKKIKLTAILLTLSIFVSTFTGHGKNSTAKPPESDNQAQQESLPSDNIPMDEGRVDAANIGDLNITDINGKEYSSDFFKDYDLTLVNIFTTWCSPCIGEMPELEKFKKEMNAKGINVTGIVYDSVSPSGEINQDAIDTAKLLQKKSNLTFPLLIPDETKMNGRLEGIDGYPESFFIDKNGNIVGETYVGARSFEEWKEIAEKELANLKGTIE